MADRIITPERSKYCREWQRNYRKNNRVLYNNKHAKYVKENRDKMNVIDKKAKLKYQSQWIEKGIVPETSQCDICGKQVSFTNGTTISRIHFDHRHGGKEPIKCKSPSSWLRSHPPTAENIKLWADSDFGKLCLLCNRGLPTKNRELFVSKLVNYVFKRKELT